MSQATSRSQAGFANYSDFSDEEPLDASSAQAAWIAFGVLTFALVAAYFNMLQFTATNWSKDMYSHGYIVPLFAAYLLWIRKRPLVAVEAVERWIGVGVVGACLGARVYAGYYDINNLDRLSFIGALLGVCLIIGGKSMLKWAGPALLFLVFMYPLPTILEATLLMKLLAARQHDFDRHAGYGLGSRPGVQRAADAHDLRRHERGAGDDY
jgi:hypothetical protein